MGDRRHQVGPLTVETGACPRGAQRDDDLLDGADPFLAAATEWVHSRHVDSYVPVSPGVPETEPAQRWLADNGFSPGYAWMKFARDVHPPRFAVPEDVEVVDYH